jgi:hypothetical protein
VERVGTEPAQSLTAAPNGFAEGLFYELRDAEPDEKYEVTLRYAERLKKKYDLTLRETNSTGCRVVNLARGSNAPWLVAAALLPRLIQEARAESELRSADSLLEFLQGPEDGYTMAGCRRINAEVFGSETPSVVDASLHIDQKIERFRKRALELFPPSRMAPARAGQPSEDRRLETAAFVFFGPRPAWDVYAFNGLTSPAVGDDEARRGLPSTLYCLNTFDDALL